MLWNDLVVISAAKIQKKAIGSINLCVKFQLNLSNLWIVAVLSTISFVYSARLRSFVYYVRRKPFFFRLAEDYLPIRPKLLMLLSQPLFCKASRKKRVCHKSMMNHFSLFAIAFRILFTLHPSIANPDKQGV